MVKRAPKAGRSVYCFPDTNVFLHFTFFPEVDWPSQLQCDRVCLVISAPVLRELEKYKNDRASERRRNRSRRVLKEFEQLTANWKPRDVIELRAGTTLELDVSSPDMTPHTGLLDAALEDDRILAHILKFKSDHPEADVLLLSDDRGMRLKARALDIRCLVPPEELRLGDEPTATERELARLQGEVASLRDKVAILSLQSKSPGGRSSELVFRYAPPGIPSDEEVTAMVEKRKKQLIWKSQARGLFQYRFPHEEREIESYLPRYRGYVITRAEYLSFAATLIEVSLTVLNSGLVPAEDVVVEVEFPSGFHVFTEYDFPVQPMEPTPPQIGTLRVPFSAQGRRLTRSIGPVPIPDSGWKVNQSRGVSHTLAKVIHNVPEDLDRIVVRVPECTQQTSFQIPYLVHAGNLPRPAAGELTLHVEPDAPEGV